MSTQLASNTVRARPGGLEVRKPGWGRSLNSNHAWLPPAPLSAKGTPGTKGTVALITWPVRGPDFRGAEGGRGACILELNKYSM